MYLLTVFEVILIIIHFIYFRSFTSTASSITNNIDSQHIYHPEYHSFPDSIPIFNVRKDKYTGLEVSRGRLNDLGITKLAHPIDSIKYNYSFLTKYLQCSSSLPDMNSRGSLNMLDMSPLTKTSVEIICAWAETFCSPWSKCQEEVITNKEGRYNHKLQAPGSGKSSRGFRDFRLLRIMNNSLHHDWPWGMERFESKLSELSMKLTEHYMLIQMILSVISDMKDCIFFFGHERSILPWNIPFPAFSFAPQMGYTDFPFPFLEMYKIEYRYESDASTAGNYSDYFYSSRHQVEWYSRKQKAAFYSSLDPQQPRHLIYDQAIMRPDLFDASFISTHINPWNPSSNETTLNNKQYNETKLPERQHPGYAQYVEDLWTGHSKHHYDPGEFKYVIVPAGAGSLSLSGRISNLIAHSGAVVLLQETSMSYHFSVRFKPWVHYVPLSYNMADAIDKIEWLIEHDDRAKQIAINGWNFGKSYLRMEDYYCYAAKSLNYLADQQKGTDVLEPFNAVRIPTELFYSS